MHALRVLDTGKKHTKKIDTQVHKTKQIETCQNLHYTRSANSI